VGQRVQVASGRHAGQFGTVVSSGNGWVQIETAVGEVAKRAYELQVVSHTSSSASHLDSGPQRNNKRARTSKSTRGGGDDSSVGGESRARLFLGDTSDDNPGSLLLNLATSSDAGSTFRKHKRPRSYSDSLMTLSPSLLGDGNYFTFRNPFSPSSSGASASSSMAAVSGLLGSLPDDDSDRFSLSNKSYLHSHRAALTGGSGSMYSATPRAPIRPSAFIEAKKSYISKYVQRHSQKISNRPNLVDWKQQLDAALVTDALFERQAARVFDESHCDVCSLDKWPGAKFCWNECCPISPIYFKLTGVSRVSSAAASVAPAPDVEVFPGGSHSNAMEVDSQASLSRPSSMADLETHFGPARTALTLRPNGPVANRASEYLLHMPAKLLGTPCARSTNTAPFSAHAEGSPRGVGPTIQPFSLMQDDGQGLVDMVPRKRPATGGYDTMRNTSSASGTSSSGGMNPNAMAYTQYFHSKHDRSDSFAGETDTEVSVL